jgi:hypothetical protein
MLIRAKFTVCTKTYSFHGPVPFKLVLYPLFLILLGTRFRGAYVVTEPVVFHIAVHVRKVGLSSLLSRLTVSVTEM